MSTGELLLEVRCEEIPARMLRPGVGQIGTRLFEELLARHLAPEKIETNYTLRRLVVVMRGIPDREPDREERVTGPPASVAYDEEGGPTAALEGFAGRLGVEPSELATETTEKGEYVVAVRQIEGRRTVDVLAALLPDLLAGVSWPRPMRWANGIGPWVRPVHSIVALFDGEVVPFELFGVASGDVTIGHPRSSPESFRVGDAEEYVAKLRERGVLIDVESRRDALSEGLEAAAAEAGGELVADSELLDELTALCEIPGVVRGSFGAVDLPREILVTSLRDHQSAFTVERDGELLPEFVTLMDRADDPAERIRRGNEWVVEARLEDARFFYREDRKRSLEERRPDLERLAFHERLGDYAAKAERIAELGRWLARQLELHDLESPVERAAQLAKVDLTTEVVKEFTSLQGVMGGIYARQDGEEEAVWQAVYDQYRPASTDDSLPRGEVGRIVSLADRIDTLSGMFGCGLVPTGSKDPFGLRRSAQGAVRIVLEAELDIDLELAAAYALSLYGDALEADPDEVLPALRPFLLDRVRHLLGLAGYAYDEIEAAVAAGAADLPDLERRVAALHEVRERPGFRSVVLAAKRIVNILRGVEADGELVEERLVEPAEQALFQATRKLRSELDEVEASGEYAAGLKSIARFAEVLDRFFVEVLVMDEDADLRANRLALLQSIERTLSRLAHLTEIVVDKGDGDEELRRGVRMGETTEKWIYAFGGGTAEASGDEVQLLGGKGAGLAQMSRLGIPVPPGFTLTTAACRRYHESGEQYPEGLEGQFREHLERLEADLDKEFGDPERPLLLSVRSGAPISMPGMMDTILNLGLNEEIVRAQAGRGWDERFLRDCYRRLISMYCDVVLGVPHAGFEKILAAVRRAEEVESDAEISSQGLEEVIERSLTYAEEEGAAFPDDPMEQLWGAVGAVFKSWNVRRAREYRRLHGISEEAGTAVNVQTMVFGNRGPDCATGVAFTRDPSTGEKVIYGEYLVNAQGEDVVAGIRTPRSILDEESGGLEADFPAAFGTLVEVCETLERERREMQDVEFTIEEGELFMLQTRAGKRSGPAAVRIAVEMVEEGLIDRSTALGRVDGTHVAQMLAPEFDPEERQAAIDAGHLLARGLAAGPGAASGRIALTAERAAEMAAEGSVLLVRDETSPEDIVGMHASAGILTSRGGMTSHAAVVARGLGKPCIVGAGDLVVDEEAGELRVGERVFTEGDVLSIEGSLGEILAGDLSPQPSEVLNHLMEEREGEIGSPAARCFLEFLEWADAEKRLGVRANADTPHDARVAVALGAIGIGLCRTEHMFFDEERLPWIRQVILSRRAEDRDRALAKLLPEQQADFEGILEAMRGMPVTIRLLDPPLHEFLPRERSSIEHLAAQMDLDVETIRDTVESLDEANPMLGHRGCRLGLTTPEIYDMQVEAIARATAALRRRDIDARPEIMVPLVGSESEMARLRQRIARVVERVLGEEEVEHIIPIGTMIEIPRAALVAEAIARHTDFFSFGTNDLTQMTFGYSRDDAARFLPFYVEERILPSDPFAQLDATGVGELVRIACERGRAHRADLKLGICGEHGGDPASIEFFESCDLDYVSCSPYRVPVARVAAAQASLARRAEKDTRED